MQHHPSAPRTTPLLIHLTPFQTSHQYTSPCIPYRLISHSPEYVLAQYNMNYLIPKSYWIYIMQLLQPPSPIFRYPILTIVFSCLEYFSSSLLSTKLWKLLQKYRLMLRIRAQRLYNHCWKVSAMLVWI